MLNQALNAIKSTLQGSDKWSQLASGWKSATNSMKAAGMSKDWGSLGAAGKAFGKRMKYSTGLQRTGAGAAAGAAGVTGVAAADFLNPWGLGWGD